MKIKKLRMENFANFKDFEVEFNGEVTRLVGMNGSGKTTVGLVGLWACLKGISESDRGGSLIGERFRFIGSNKKTADVELTLLDNEVEIKVKNHISKSGNEITFEAPDNYPISKQWLNDLLSIPFLSAENFCQRSGKQQALLLGIDTTEFDNKLKELKKDFTEKNRTFRDFGELEEPEKVEKVSIVDLMKKKDDIFDFNQLQDNKQTAIDEKHQEQVDAEQLLETLEESIPYMKEQIEEAEEILKQKKEALKTLNERIKTGLDVIKTKEEEKEALPKPETLQDNKEVFEQIANAEETNQKSYEHEAWTREIERKKQAEKAVQDNKKLQVKEEEKRLKYIQSFPFKFDGLDVSESGELLLNDRPIKAPYFSKGEREIIVAKLYQSMNPKLKVRFIDDFELLDEKNQKKILESLTKDGFQIITAEVGDEVKKENTIHLRDCKVVDNSKPKGKKKDSIL